MNGFKKKILNSFMLINRNIKRVMQPLLLIDLRNLKDRNFPEDKSNRCFERYC